MGMISECILEGETVRLRPIHEGDLPHFVAWLNDPEVRHWLALSEAPPLTLEAERNWYQEMREDQTGIVWCIDTREGKPIGSLGLHGINETHGRAMLGISIGEKSHWGQGYGTDVIKQVLAYAFGELGLRRVELHVDEDNERGIRCYEKCGFVREGMLRAHRLREGNPVDCLVMAIVRTEWEEGASG